MDILGSPPWRVPARAHLVRRRGASTRLADLYFRPMAISGRRGGQQAERLAPGPAIGKQPGGEHQSDGKPDPYPRSFEWGVEAEPDGYSVSRNPIAEYRDKHRHPGVLQSAQGARSHGLDSVE